MAATSSFLPALSRVARTFRALPGGKGIVDGGALIFACHRVSKPDPAGIQANEDLKVSTEYLAFFVRRLRSHGYSFVSLDDLAAAVLSGRKTQGLVSLTFDDGYRDNLENALPTLERLDIPFAIFALRGSARHTAFLWWLALDSYLRDRSRVRFSDRHEVSCATSRERERLFMRIRGLILEKADGDPQSFLAGLLPDFNSAVPYGQPDRCLLSESELRSLGKRPLVTIGSHTATHPNLAKLTEPEAFGEICESKRSLESILGKDVRHFAYPFGGRSEAGEREYRLAARAGFLTASTMNAGSVPRGDAGCLHRLPRVEVREGADPLDLISENRARAWARRARRLAWS